MNRVYAQMFHMVPVDLTGQPIVDPEDPHTFGYEVHDEAEEFSDYGLTLAEVQALFTPDSIMTSLHDRMPDLAEWAAEHGLYLNGYWYNPTELAPPFEDD